MTLSAGVRLGPYEIHSALGAGGMGEVWKARDTTLGRDVALKILPDHLALDPDRLVRFKREAQILASLNHPNIAAIYGFQEADGTQALVLELVNGPTLAERIARGPIPVDEALPIAKQIAEALEAAHEQGIIHRDLKPANIKMRPDGTVKVLDFGLAKALSNDTSAANISMSPTLTSPELMTVGGVILGTAAYMSPEQAKGKTADARSDIWAFGVVLFEMLTGRACFTGESAVEIMGGVLKTEPDWTALPSTTPSTIRALLRRCLQKDPSRRLRDIVDARFQIEEALTEQPNATPAPTPPRRVRQWPLWTAAIMLTIAAGAALTSWYFSQAPAEISEVRLQINTGAGNASSFAISPDGTKVVYQGPTQNGLQLLVRSLQSETPMVLAGTERAPSPFWSPDSQSIGFFSGGRLQRIDVAGGRAQMIADMAAAAGGTWNREDVILLGNAAGSLLRVSALGGRQPVEATMLAPRQTSHRYPQFLPDGQHFFFYVTGAPDVRGIYIGSFDSKETRRLVDADTGGVFAPPDFVLFVRGTTLYAQHVDIDTMAVSDVPLVVADVEREDLVTAGLLVHSASLTGTLAYRGVGRGTERQLTWYDRLGKPLATVGDPDRSRRFMPRLSPDGRYVAIFRNLNGNGDLWLIETMRGVLRRITFDTVSEGWPVWSPDGARLLFNSYLNGKTDLYVMSTTAGDAATLLLDTPAGKNPSDWSANGYVLYSDLQGTLWALPTEKNAEPFTISRLGSWGQFSPDGRWVAYSSTESGTSEIYLQPFPGPGTKTRISTAGGRWPTWRGDEREVFYIASDSRLMAVPLSGSGPSIEAGSPVPLFVLNVEPPPLTSTLSPYDVSPDGQRILVDTIVGEGETAPITVVLNWGGGKRK